MVTNNFYSGSKDYFEVICNVFLVLPIKYDCVIEVTQTLEFVKNNGCVEEQSAFFERPDQGMKNYLKPLFIRAKVEDTTINKILVDGRVVVNLIPHFLLNEI